MAFQFLCPEGHLLEIEESQVGQKCRCPQCSVEFLVPEPDAPPPVQPSEPSGFPVIRTGDPHKDVANVGGLSADDVAAGFGVPAAETRSLVHIPCPRGHVLETPREMIGQDAMCPFCQTQFHLRLEDSEEYRRQQAEQQERREQRVGQTWMYWSFAIAAVVLLGLLLLIVLSTLG
jgi:hypothetical protein